MENMNKVCKSVGKNLEKMVIFIFGIRWNDNNAVTLRTGLVSFSSRQNP
jgi:hypothetical protein